ncbi:trafficking protein particle complex subunit 6A isoform X2 [Suricata suricatta]|uniref:trafficking protein particle complex subunit 6A isoform X2 n=1 Tax=Suricata suricatta TaxID=37032 RepID=UPI001155D71A|nr:trafficking protein particle complex subunit 6A isoform X2 [Suricata suricatta]
MADAALFEFLHMEMVAELWSHHYDPGPGGQKMSLSVLEGMGFRVGQALGESPSGCPPLPTLGYPRRPWPSGRSWTSSSSYAKTCGWPCSKSRWTASAPITREPTCCRTTASPSSSGWPRACSIWRKHPSSWPSPAASCEVPSAPWASRAWSPPPWHPCPPVSSRW